MTRPNRCAPIVRAIIVVHPSPFASSPDPGGLATTMEIAGHLPARADSNNDPWIMLTGHARRGLADRQSEMRRPRKRRRTWRTSQHSRQDVDANVSRLSDGTAAGEMGDAAHQLRLRLATNEIEAASHDRREQCPDADRYWRNTRVSRASFHAMPPTPLNETREPSGELSRLHARFVISRAWYGRGGRDARSVSNTTIRAGSPAGRHQYVQLVRGAKLTRDVRVKIDRLLDRHQEDEYWFVAIETADRLKAGRAVWKALNNQLPGRPTRPSRLPDRAMSAVISGPSQSTRALLT